VPAPVTQYASTTDLDNQINAGALSGVTTQQKTDAIDKASREMDGYFRDPFTLPFVQVGTDVAMHCANIAIYRLMVGRGYNPESGGDPGIRDRYKDALAWCTLVSKGTITPDVTDSSSGASEGHATDGPMVISSASRGFSSRGDANGKVWPFQGT